MAAALAGVGYKVELWFAEDFPQLIKRRRLSVIWFPVALAIRIVLRRRRFQAVVIREPSGFWYGVLRRVWRSLPPMVAMSHGVESRVFRDMEAAAARGFARMRLRSRLIARAVRFWQSDGALKLADHVVCLNSVDRRYAVERLRIPAESVTVMINGVGRSFVGNAAHRPVAEGRVLFVGGWLDVKGRRVLPKIWKGVRARFHQAQLSIIGSGCPPEMVEADFEMELKGSVHVVPRVEDEQEMAGQYLSHSVFLMPSLQEGSPLSLLEAMASGLAVVASRVGGIPEIVTDGEDGLLFDSMDIQGAVARVCLVLSQPEAAQRLGQRAMETARRLSWQASAETMAGAIRAAQGKV